MYSGWLDFAPKILKWVFDRRTRLHHSGYRVEVICFAIDAETRQKLLLTNPRAEPSLWVPPQEGVNGEETIEQAAVRCLKMELGLSEGVLHYRRSTWIGKRSLPPERVDERDLEGSFRKYVSKEAMIGKAYYAALVHVPSRVTFKLNQAEVIDTQWVLLNEVMTNLNGVDLEKLDILVTSLKRLHLMK